MLSRRSFFAAAAGAVAGAAGVASATPAALIVVDPWHSYHFDWANDAGVAPSTINDAARAEARLARMQEIFKDIRGQQLPPWPYPRIELAANLPVAPPIGEPLPKNTPAQERRHRQLLKKCNDENPPKNETDAQYLKRMSLPCPGRLE